MRVLTSLPYLGVALLATQAFGQTLPGAPEENGLSPVAETVYVNTSDTLNNGNTESLGVAIARNGNVMVGWEDDGEGLSDLEAVWTLYDRDSKPITPDTEITSVDPTYAGEVLTSRFLSYFRANGSAISGRTGWGPKIKANLFGDGLGMGATSFDLGLEVVEYAGYQDAGDWPAVQLVTDTGAPVGIVNGVSVEYGARPGNIRIGDWHYLSTGNIAVVGESRQGDDLVSQFSGESAQNHVIVRLVDKAGKEIKAAQLVGATPTKSEMWHGIGVTKNGFAVRFSDNGPGRIRIFDNAGVPVSTNIDLATIAGNPIAGGGGRGDGVGFHGNGNDAYAAVAVGRDAEGLSRVWVTVLNANGTLRWSKSVSDDLELVAPGRCDVGIDSLGRVAVVYDDAAGTGGNARIILGRVFDATGNPLGKTFYVSEKELPAAETLESKNPRVAFRNDSIAVVWESRNSGNPDQRVVALRQFVVPVRPGSIESVGLTRIVPDTTVDNPGVDALGNWEPYASVLGTTTFLIEGNTFADQSTTEQRFVVALQPAAGGTPKLGEAFFTDAGVPFKGAINASRQNGNPGRVAGDARPGAVNFIVGAEASPHVVEGFNSDNRFTGGFDRLGDGRYGVVQTYRLDPVTLAQTPLSKAQDSANGRLTSGGAPGSQITRFGGDVVCLSDGNFVSVVEDKSLVRRPEGGDAAVATIFAPDGSIVKESFKVADGSIWANVTAFKGGFAVRVGGKLYFYNNAGDLQGEPVAQSTSGENFDGGRGDGTRLGGHINQPWVFLVGRVVGSTAVRVAIWDARTRALATVADVSEGGFRADADRAVVACDALGRFTVAWVSKPDGYEAQQIAARVFEMNEATKTVTPLTASFLPFINASPVGGIRSIGMTVAMTTRQILVAAKGEINLQNRPDQGANSSREVNFYTVVSHPAPKDDTTPPVGGGGAAPRLAVKLANGQLTITSEPQPLPAGYVMEVSGSVSGPWVPQPGANTPITLPLGTEAARFLRAVKR